MKEILFRGKRVDNGRWVYGFCWYVKKYHNLVLIKRHFIKSLITFKDIEVIPETVGQFTGLTDKNGTKIFEGDRLKDELGNVSTVVFGKIGYDSSQNGLTGFVLDSWYNERLDAYELNYYFDFHQVEVIGNIHDKGETNE